MHGGKERKQFPNGMIEPIENSQVTYLYRKGSSEQKVEELSRKRRQKKAGISLRGGKLHIQQWGEKKFKKEGELWRLERRLRCLEDLGEPWKEREGEAVEIF